jgi:ornithine carbamoyltransferase
MYKELKGKNFITLEDWSKDQIEILLSVSSDLKNKFKKNEINNYVKNQTAFLMFFEQSTRTRNSMEAGMTQLGGHAHFLDTSTMQISHGEVAKDTAIILSRYGHAIACRNCFWGIGNKYLNDMAKWSTAPIINMQCDLYHPLQVIADLMTIREKFYITKNLKISIIWAYAKSHKKPISVPLSQSLLFPRFGMDVTLAHPVGYELPDWVIAKAKKNAEENGGSFKVTNNQDAAYRDADIVIPKNWGDWVTNPDEMVGGKLLASNKHWKCSEERMALTKNTAIYMHALPADRQNEVEDAVIDGPKSIIYDEAENRLHTSKAVMALTMNSTYTG